MATLAAGAETQPRTEIRFDLDENNTMPLQEWQTALRGLCDTLEAGKQLPRCTFTFCTSSGFSEWRTINEPRVVQSPDSNFGDRLTVAGTSRDTDVLIMPVPLQPARIATWINRALRRESDTGSRVAIRYLWLPPGTIAQLPTIG